MRFLLEFVALVVVAFVVGAIAYPLGYKRGQASHFKRLAAVGSRFADPDWEPNQ